MKIRLLIPVILIMRLIGITPNAFADIAADYSKDDVEAEEYEYQPRRIIPIGNLELLGSYSDIDQGSDLWGFSATGSFSPVVRLDENKYLIPLYHGAVKRLRQYITQEEGGRLYNTWQIHNGSLALRTKHSDRLSSRVSALGTWNFLRETRDESFGDGLYDYRDFGGSLDMRYYITPLKVGKRAAVSGGLQYFRREYPNYQSLISLASQTAPEKDEKSFDGVKFSAGFEGMDPEGINWEFKSSMLLKYFVDKRLIGEDGVLNMNKKRRDYIIEANLNLMHPFLAGRWEIGIDNSIIYNHSNLGFYDSRDDPLNISNDVFTKNYYTYLTALIYPHVTYYYHLSRDKRIAVRIGYSFLRRDYADRKAQDSDSTYTNKDQKDQEHALHCTTSFPITKTIAWITSFDYTLVSSNQNYEKYYRYEYDVYQIQAGISLSF